jgi:hypothetical protein
VVDKDTTLGRTSLICALKCEIEWVGFWWCMVVKMKKVLKSTKNANQDIEFKNNNTYISLAKNVLIQTTKKPILILIVLLRALKVLN